MNLNRSSPFPLWVALCLGVIVISGVYVKGKTTIAPQLSSSRAPNLLISRSTPNTSATSSQPIVPTNSALASHWLKYRNSSPGFEFKYPHDWVNTGRPVDIGDFFIASGVGVLSLTKYDLPESSSIEQFVQSKIARNNCRNNDGSLADRIIRSDERGVLYVLYCSATTEGYLFDFRPRDNIIVELDYHDAFDESWTLDQKLVQFNDIIASIEIR